MIVEVAYATPSRQVILSVECVVGTKVKQAIELSGVLARFPEIDLALAKVGIFSKKATLETVLRPGDRVEIYRPLLIDPKQARLLRAKKNQSAG